MRARHQRDRHPLPFGDVRRRLRELAGAHLSLVYTPQWVEKHDRRSRLDRAGAGGVRVVAAVARAGRGLSLFGAISIAQLHIQAIDLNDLGFLPGPLYWLAGLIKSVPSQFLSSLPYLATVIVLVLISRNRRLTMMNTPASLGRPFVPDR
jgi:simple sugar transport system permease protein